MSLDFVKSLKVKNIARKFIRVLQVHTKGLSSAFFNQHQKNLLHTFLDHSLSDKSSKSLFNERGILNLDSNALIVWDIL
jgi:hypothetical protein